MLEQIEEHYLMMRDLWPGLAPREFNEGFTVEQTILLLEAEDDWDKKKRRAAKRQSGIERVSGREMLDFLN